MMTDPTPIPEQRCWRCDYLLALSTSAIGEHKAHPGDISMCIACGAVAIFTDDLHLRRPTPDEEAALSDNPVLLRAQIYRASVVGDKLKGKKQ